MVESEYRNLKKKIDDFGGEERIKLCLNKEELLITKNWELESEIKELESKLTQIQAEKGESLLHVLKDVQENSEIESEKSKKELLEDLSARTNEILELKEEIKKLQNEK